MPIGIGTAFGTMSSNVDNDWYVLSLEEGKSYTARLKGIPDGDDYDLYIFDPNLLDIGLSFNNGNADEFINFTPAATGNYYIHADCHTLGSGSDHSYQMLIYPDDTAPDAYEPNDSMGTAKTICNNTPLNGTINIDTDEDWYVFNADYAGKLTVTLDGVPNDCDYDVEIYDVDSNILSGSYFSGNTSEKADVLVGIGNYYVRVYSYSGSGESAYSLNVNLSTPDRYEINDSVSSATEVLVDSSSFGTIDNIKDEDYFKVEIEETENYVFELQNIPSGKDYDLSLYDSAGNAVAYSWNSSNADELINMSLNSGCYYIKIHSYYGYSSEQNYMVSVYKENALTLSMPYIRANAGDTISVPVVIQNLPTEGLCSFDFAVDYDATAMTYLDYTVDYSDSSWALVDTEQVVEANKESDGVIKVLFLDNSTTFTKPLNQSGIVIKLNFQVNTAVSDGAYDICCNYGGFAKDSFEDIVAVSHAMFKHGLVMVGGYGLTSLQTDDKAQNLISMVSNNPKDGDVNWDGNVDSIDFANYRKFLLGGGFPTATGHSYTEVADLDGDGNCNSIDFGRFRKYLLGMISYFPIQALRVPSVTLTSPSNGSSYGVGQKVHITATGINCHHISVFVNGKYIEELSGNNPGYSYVSYDYTIPYAGTFSIGVKGRNVPGSSDGTLSIPTPVTVQGTGGTDYSISKVADNMQRLADLATQYKQSNSISSSVNELVLQYIRRGPRYSGSNWPSVAGAINSGFVSYVNNNASDLTSYFNDRVIIKDPLTQYEVDFVHWAATLNGLIYDTGWSDAGYKSLIGEAHIDNLCGWAGDLQTLIKDVIRDTNQSDNYNTLYNSAIILMGTTNSQLGSTFPMNDLLADTDASNINNKLSSSSLVNAFRDFYSNGTGTRYQDFTVKRDKESIRITDNQSRAVRDAFTDFVWNKVQGEY